MSELLFVDELPEAGQGKTQTRERAEEIKANAPRWAQWPSTTPPSAIKKALEKIDQAFEVVGRKCADGKVRAFVRYAPQEDAPTKGNGHAPTPPPSPVVPGGQRVKCPTCGAFLTTEAGEDGPAALARHEAANVVCKAGNRRRR